MSLFEFPFFLLGGERKRERTTTLLYKSWHIVILSIKRHKFSKICIIEVYLLKSYFESHFIYKWCYYRQTIFNQLNMIVLCHSVAILVEIYLMWPRCHNRWLLFHFKCMLANYGTWSIDFKIVTLVFVKGLRCLSGY